MTAPNDFPAPDRTSPTAPVGGSFPSSVQRARNELAVELRAWARALRALRALRPVSRRLLLHAEARDHLVADLLAAAHALERAGGAP